MPIKGDNLSNVVRIKVVGVGGGGNNVVSRMVASGVEEIEFVNVNTDKPTLMASGADVKLQIGEKLTGGQGAGSDPRVGKMAAEEDRNNISKIFDDADAVFVTAGMGGGTGTGAAPVVSEIARESGALTIGVVTTPFKFEGAAKMRRAQEGIKELLGKVDTLFVIPNEKLKEYSDQKITFANAFEIADSVLHQAVTGIADLLRNTGFINLDFADLKTIMRRSGIAHLGVGEASGKNKVEEAARDAIYSKLMGTTVDGARRVIINVTGSVDISMEDVEKIVGKVQGAAHPDANIIFGVDFDEELIDAMRVIVIATDYETEEEKKAAEAPAPDPEAVEAAEAAPKAEEMDWEDIMKIFNK
ncbi:MAG: cell division protein FtsZ [Oscillospiraceae bacterium]|nr:cell division protein FtsZ [Oscillospiraceae bacterium]